MLGCLLWTTSAFAQDGRSAAAPEARQGPEGDPEALYHRGELDEASGDYAGALDAYAACARTSPSSRYAPRATTRADYLRAHSEGEFAPLARLEQVRHDPSLASDPASIDRLAHDLEAFPPGAVRVEARMLVAEAYLVRLNRRADGEDELRKVLDEPKSDPLTARQAARKLVDSRVASGDIDGAVACARAQSKRLEPRYVKTIERLVLRRTLDRIAVIDLALLAVLALISLSLAKRRGRAEALRVALRRAAPIAIAFVAYVTVAGGWLASKYESGNSKPFLVFGGALLPLLFAARAWGASGSPKLAARVGRALLCGSSAMAAAFMVLERIDPAYLDGFGL